MNNITEILHDKGYDFKYVASLMNIDPSLLELWAKKEYTMSINQAIRLSEILNVSLNHIYLDLNIKTLDISQLDNFQINILYQIINKNRRFKRKKISSKTINLINTEDLGERIKFIRTEILGWTQNEIAKAFNVSRNTSKYWDSGMYFTSLDRARDLSIISHISLDFILLPKHTLELSSYGLNNDLFQILEELVMYFNMENKNAK